MKKSTVRKALGLTPAEVEATGCAGADSYRDFAKSLGFTHVEPIDLTSSAGDWTFVVSKDGHKWRLLSQYNKWPFVGFHHEIDKGSPFYGTAREVQEEIFLTYYQPEL